MICPYCDSELNEGVIKCKFCGEFIDRKYIPTTSKHYMSGFVHPIYRKKPHIYCPSCGYEGKAGYQREGNSGVTFLLMRFFIIPGLIYEGSRKKYWCCKKCKNYHINMV